MKKLFLNNWILKVASLLFAFALWFLVINLTDPTDTKTFSNISVSLINTDILSEDQVYEVIEDTDIVKSVTVSGPSSILLDLTADNIVATADFENLTATQTVEIEFSSNMKNDDLEKITGNISFVKLNIEDKKTSYLTLQVETQGEVAEGYLLSEIKPEQNRLTISGPESVVSQVVKAAVIVDVSNATDNINTRSNVVLYDEAGKEIISDSLLSSFTSVSVSVEVLATKWISVKTELMGNPATGYQATGEVVSSPSQILVAGKDEVLNTVSSVTIPAEALNITGQTDDMMTVINISDYLADGISFADSTYDGKVVTTVIIEKEIEKTYTLLGSQITMTNVPLDLNAVIDSTQEFKITLTGLESIISSIQQTQLNGTIDIQQYANDKYNGTLLPGIYLMPVTFDLGDSLSMHQILEVLVVVE